MNDILPIAVLILCIVGTVVSACQIIACVVELGDNEKRPPWAITGTMAGIVLLLVSIYAIAATMTNPEWAAVFP